MQPEKSKFLKAKDIDPAMPAGIPYIVGNEAAERFSRFGMGSILVVFMTQYLFNNSGVLQFSEPQAMVWYHNFVGASYCFAILGAIISDIFWGKYKTIIFFSIVYCLGHATLIFLDGKSGLFCGLALIALGSGCIKACVSAHVGDQFNRKNQHLISKVYSWFYFAIVVGGLTSALLTPYLFQNYGPKIAFGVPGILMLIATIIFYKGRKVFIAAQAIGWQKFQKEFLNPQNLKTIINLLIIFFFTAFFYTLNDQDSSSFVIQAGKMNREINLGFMKLTPGQSQVQAIDPVFTLIFAVLFPYVIYPFLHKFINLTYLKKIAAGFFVAGASFALVAYAQMLLEKGLEVSIIWQIWAYALLAIAKVLIIVTSMELCYVHTPNSLKSFVFGIYFLSAGLANLLTSFINGWIQDASGNSIVDGSIYFCYFIILAVVIGIMFVIYIPYYRGRVYLQTIRTTLPEKYLVHESKIKQVTDIILRLGGKKIAIIILSGSLNRDNLAKNTDSEGRVSYEYTSDYNFLILTNNKKHSKRKYSADLENRIKDEFVKRGLESRASFDLDHGITVTIRPVDHFDLELEKWRSRNLFSNITKREILLYNCKDFESTKPKGPTSEQIKAITKESCQHYYRNGLEFMSCANLLKSLTSNYKLSTFNLHQASENFYRCSLLLLTGERPKIHDLAEFNYLLCMESNLFFDIFPSSTLEQRTCFKLLAASYLRARYDPYYRVNLEQLEYLIGRVEKLKEVTEKICGKAIS